MDFALFVCVLLLVFFGRGVVCVFGGLFVSFVLLKKEFVTKNRINNK